MSAVPARVVGSKHDHNVVPGTQTATNVRAHKERLPFATWETRLVSNMSGWDMSGSTPSGRAAARARYEAARANAHRIGYVTTLPTARRGR